MKKKKRTRAGEVKNMNDFEQERKDHNKTKKSLEALVIEYSACKKELGGVQEDKERLKIKVKDLEDLIRLSKNDDKIEILEETREKEYNMETFICQECEYPFRTTDAKDMHVKKHKGILPISEVKHICSICQNETDSYNDLRSHIQLKHNSEFNCIECDFQASSQIILSKHMNLRHREKN